jgi:hypothetical protein
MCLLLSLFIAKAGKKQYKFFTVPLPQLNSLTESLMKRIHKNGMKNEYIYELTDS